MMTFRVFGLAALAALLMLAPLAAAEADGGNTTDGTRDRPDDAAWVEDCPPDMMCAASEDDGEVKDDPRGPEDCAFCRGDDAPDEPADGTTWGTDCPEGVYCMSYGDGPADSGPVDCDGDVCLHDQEPVGGAKTSTESAEEASALAAPVFLGALGLVGLAFVAALRRD